MLAWHNPDPEYMNAPVDGLVNVMSPPWFDREHYRSDSNQHWRSGYPTEALARGEFEWLQLLTHPEIWVFEGDDDARDDGVDARRRARGAAGGSSPTTGSTSREADHRPRHGARARPGTAALVRALRENGEREVRLVGADMSERSVGRHLCDAFHLVPPATTRVSRTRCARSSSSEGVDVVLPQSSFDLPGLAEAREAFPVPVLVSSPETVRRSNDKAETYALLRELGVPAPDFRRVRGGDGGRGGGARARLPGARRRREAGLLVRARAASASSPRGADRHEQLLTNRPGRRGVAAARGARRAARRRTRRSCS